jgi:hypothetical protein
MQDGGAEPLACQEGQLDLQAALAHGMPEGVFGLADPVLDTVLPFVMISQNRADEKRQVLADHQWQTVQEEEQQNEQLLALSNQILELTKAIHAMDTARSPTGRDDT